MLDPAQLFDGRTLLLASMHGKEQAIAPVLEEAFHIKVEVAQGINTDTLGTFSGERERKSGPLQTMQGKIEMARAKYADADLFLASEGSFFPHPHIPFATLNSEELLLVDTKLNLEIHASHHSLDVFAKKEIVNCEGALEELLPQFSFPQYGIIMSCNSYDGLQVEKQLQSKADIIQAFHHLLAKSIDKQVTLQTDLRAHKNPKRMEKIGLAAEELVRLMRSACPACSLPGFAMKDEKRGLPCSWCGLPTHLVKAYGYRCEQCFYEEWKPAPNAEAGANPQYCNYCNP
jgi:hypothetical protein